MILVWLMPWSSFLPQALRQVRLRLLRTANMRTSQEAALLLFFVWVIVILLFFSFSTRQEYYLAPALPGICLLLGSWLARESESAYGSDIARSGRISSTVYFGVGCLTSAVTLTLAITPPLTLTFVVISHAPHPNMELADLLKKNPDAYVLFRGHFLDLIGAAMSI